jgi:DNA topoisomerase-2
VEKLLKLYTTMSTNNMHLFDDEDKLKKYDKITDIIDDYFIFRLKLYQTRKEYIIKSLERELILLSNKARYIKENIDGTIDLRKKKKEHVIDMLEHKKYDMIDDDDEYKYLVKLPMDSVTEENVDKLFKEHKNKELELKTVKNTSIHTMWNSELTRLREEYIVYKEERELSMSGEKPKKKILKKK